jgi:hypothetical protein
MANRLVDLTDSPVSHRKQRRRPQAQTPLALPMLMRQCARHDRGQAARRQSEVLRLHSPRPHPQHVYRNRPSTCDTMNDPTKQDDKPGLPTPSVSKPSRRLAAKYGAQQNAASGMWSIKAGRLSLQKE